MSFSNSVCGAFVALSLVLGPVACGGGGGSPTQASTPAPTSTGTRTVLGQGNWQAAAAPAGTRDLTGGDVFFFPVVLNTAATLDAVVDWTLQSNDVEFAFHQGTCTLDNLGTSTCVSVVESGRVAKPGTISKAVAAGNYTLLIVNYGPAGESGTWQIGFTK